MKYRKCVPSVFQKFIKSTFKEPFCHLKQWSDQWYIARLMRSIYRSSTPCLGELRCQGTKSFSLSVRSNSPTALWGRIYLFSSSKSCAPALTCSCVCSGVHYSAPVLRPCVRRSIATVPRGYSVVQRGQKSAVHQYINMYAQMRVKKQYTNICVSW